MASEVDSFVSRHLAALNSHDPPAVLALYTEDCLWAEPPGAPAFEGKHTVEKYLIVLFHAFPDLRLSVLRVLSARDWIVAEWRAEGTQQAGFMGLPSTGKAIDLHGASILDLKDGKVQRSHHYCDSGRLLRQLGLWPPGKFL
jgi:steroid delta-isomerase-like uncharacterized protein